MDWDMKLVEQFIDWRFDRNFKHFVGNEVRVSKRARI